MTKSGLTVECDAVVVGAGVRPDVMLAERAGLEVDDGIVCDSKLQTSAPGIYAAGDCCNYDSVVHGRRLRVEHWDVAMQQGIAAAANMLGRRARLRRRPLLLQRPRRLGQSRVRRAGPRVGRGRSGAATARRASSSVWYLKDGRVAGALSVERSEDLAEARRMLADGVDVSGARDALGDPDSDLSSIV